MANTRTSKNEKPHGESSKIDPAVHRRILRSLNDALGTDDLMHGKVSVTHHHEGGGAEHEDNPAERKKKPRKIMNRELAQDIINHRDWNFPLGFRHIDEAFEIVRDFDRARLDTLLHHFSAASFGSWANFPQPIPQRGPGGMAGVVHAALLHTGKVLFITADETTLLWDPENTAPTTFEDPVNQPHTMPGGYSQLCGHHVFLSDGKLLSVGGGGYGPNPLAQWGYKFDPVTNVWTRTTGPMSEAKWYPTAVALGDSRVLVTCGDRSGDMDIYDEATDTFSPVVSVDKPFPSLYPGLHLLPNHAVFYSRTGWGTAGPGGGPFTADDQSAYFMMTGTLTGAWNNIGPALPGIADRTKGMSVMLLGNTPPYVRVMVIGGADNSTSNTYEMIDVSALSGATNWSAPIPFPDGLRRSLGSAVLLPDGNVFVCGGVQSQNSPCSMFNPQTNVWSPNDELPSVRDYHSVALLLPSGKVMMAGWLNTTIEVFSPPYLFAGARPVIAAAPAMVHHGQSFFIESPDAASISKVVLVRPMAVTHQTDSEQKVLEMAYVHDHANPTRLGLVAPHGGHPHSIAQQGYYMLFAISNGGVPSVAKWIYLH